MGVFTQVARFFQRIESPTVTRQFQLVVQDYGKEKNLEEAIRKAMAEASTHPGVEAREVMMSGHKAFAVTDRSNGNPTTLVTVHRAAVPARARRGRQRGPRRVDQAALLRRLREGRGGEVSGPNPAPSGSGARRTRTGREWSSSIGSSPGSSGCRPRTTRRRRASRAMLFDERRLEALVAERRRRDPGNRDLLVVDRVVVPRAADALSRGPRGRGVRALPRRRRRAHVGARPRRRGAAGDAHGVGRPRLERGRDAVLPAPRRGPRRGLGPVHARRRRR